MSELEPGPAPVDDESLGRDTARGFAGLSTARVVSMVLQLVMFAALAGHLGEAGIGLFGFGLAGAQLFDVVANLGFKQVVTRDVAQDPARERWLIPNYLYLRFLLGFAAFGALSAFVFLAGYDADEREVALIAGTLLVLTAPQATQPMLEVRLRMGPIAVADVVEAGLMLGGTLVLIRADAGVTDFLWWYVATNLVNSLMIVTSALRLRRGMDWRPRPDRWLPVTRSALVLGIASVFISIYYQIDIALLARFKPQIDVGNYTAAFQALAAVNVVPAVLSTVLAPVLARTVTQGTEILQRRYSLIVHLVSLVSIPVAVGGACTAWRLLPQIPQFEEFGRGGVALSILSLAAGVIFLATIVQATLIAGHLQRRLLGVAVLGAFTNLALNLVAIPRYSLYGAAVATVVTEFAVLVQSQRLVTRHLGARWPMARTLRLAPAALAMIAVAVLTDSLPVLAQMALVGMTYLIVVMATGSLRFADLGALVSPGSATVEVRLSGRDDLRPDRVEDRYRPVLEAIGTDVDEVILHAHESVRLRALLAARAAGARRIVVHRRGSPIGRAERWRLDVFADETHVVEPAPGGILLVSEGALGTGVLGHVAALRSMSGGLHRVGVDHDVEVINGPERAVARLWSRAVPLIGWFDLDGQPSRWHAVMARKTRRRLAGRPDPDVVLFDGHTIAFGMTDLLARVPGFVMVDATVRQWAQLGLWRPVRPWTDLTMRWSYRRERRLFEVATVLAWSEWAAEGVRREHPDARIIVHSPGVDTDRFSPGPSRAREDPDRAIRILFVGGRFVEKGGPDLVDATRALRREGVELHVVTPDPVPDEEGIVVHRVQGHDPALVELYREADLFCLPTRADGSPFAVLEAMATGTPVVSTDVGAIPSLLGETGVIVPVGDRRALGAAIRALIDDTESRAALGRAARRRAEERYSSVTQAAALVEVLENERAKR